MGYYGNPPLYMRPPHELYLPSLQVGRVAAILRLERQLTQGQVELYTGLDQSRISRFERGEEGIQLEALFKLAEYYGQPLHWGQHKIIWGIDHV